MHILNNTFDNNNSFPKKTSVLKDLLFRIFSPMKDNSDVIPESIVEVKMATQSEDAPALTGIVFNLCTSRRLYWYMT